MVDDWAKEDDQLSKIPLPLIITSHLFCFTSFTSISLSPGLAQQEACQIWKKFQYYNKMHIRFELVVLMLERRQSAQAIATVTWTQRMIAVEFSSCVFHWFYFKSVVLSQQLLYSHLWCGQHKGLQGIRRIQTDSSDFFSPKSGNFQGLILKGSISLSSVVSLLVNSARMDHSLAYSCHFPLLFLPYCIQS